MGLSHPGAPFSESLPPCNFSWMAGLAATPPSLLLLIAGSICLARKLHREKEAENEEKEIACQELGKEDVEREKECQIRGKRIGGQVMVTQGHSSDSLKAGDREGIKR